MFAALVAILMYPPLRLALVPRSVKHARAHRRAVEQFLAQNLHTAVGRTGVLIFVSVAEHFAEVLADAAIHAKVPESAWQTIVDDLTDAIGKGQPGDGFVAAIAAVGEHLARHFPPDAHAPPPRSATTWSECCRPRETSLSRPSRGEGHGGAVPPARGEGQQQSPTPARARKRRLPRSDIPLEGLRLRVEQGVHEPS